MVEAGCEYAFMECSSHAIHQRRIGGLKFAGGLFTNLTRDHLDYHKTFENYRNAKKMFFDDLTKDAFAITNADDKNGMIMVQNCKAKVKTYSVKRMADFRARILECHFEGMYLEVNGKEVGVQFIGKFNVSNASCRLRLRHYAGQTGRRSLIGAQHTEERQRKRWNPSTRPKATQRLLTMPIRLTHWRTC